MPCATALISYMITDILNYDMIFHYQNQNVGGCTIQSYIGLVKWQITCLHKLEDHLYHTLAPFTISIVHRVPGIFLLYIQHDQSLWYALKALHNMHYIYILFLHIA